MKKICVIGHFAIGKTLLNGQTVKTKIVYEELKKNFGLSALDIIDTHNIKKNIFKLLYFLLKEFIECEDIIMLPAHNGVCVITPLISMLNIFFKRTLHYVVIGGWLPDFLINKKLLVFMLKNFNYIYIETKTMMDKLEKQGFNNLFLIPNCKPLNITEKNNLKRHNKKPYKVCTFSRVMKEKGIEEAIRATIECNEKMNEVIYHLDIYGEVDDNQTEWFENLKKSFPSYIKYRGTISFEKSTTVLEKYKFLLFPTYYSGEGFAGTIIDSFASGTPIIASNWKYNTDIIIENYNGFLIEYKNIESLKTKMLDLIDINVDLIRINCINEAYKYLPENALKPLINHIKGGGLK